MSCYRLWQGYRLDNGSVVGYRPEAAKGQPILLPCGRCVGCMADRAQTWGLRAVHEMRYWKHNCFLTLTYDEEHLPHGATLVRRDVQLFLKSLRRRISGVEVGELKGSKLLRPIRYFGCGEYGENTRRPHYHLCLFNVRFADTEKYDSDSYTSRLVSDVWKQGSHRISGLTEKRCYYTAGYAAKKLGRRRDGAEYDVVDGETGEVLLAREPEFSMMSLKPGIGQYWYDQFKGDLKHGYIVHNGEERPIPRYYQDKFKAECPEEFESIEIRRARCARNPDERSEERLAVKEAVFVGRRNYFKKALSTEI